MDDETLEWIHEEEHNPATRNKTNKAVRGTKVEECGWWKRSGKQVLVDSETRDFHGLAGTGRDWLTESNNILITITMTGPVITTRAWLITMMTRDEDSSPTNRQARQRPTTGWTDTPMLKPQGMGTRLGLVHVRGMDWWWESEEAQPQDCIRKLPGLNTLQRKIKWSENYKTNWCLEWNLSYWILIQYIRLSGTEIKKNIYRSNVPGPTYNLYVIFAVIPDVYRSFIPNKTIFTKYI